MPSVAWIASYPRSGNTWMRVLLSNYLADAPEESPWKKMGRIPDVSDVLSGGRLFPDDKSTDSVVMKTHFPPHDYVMQSYRASTSKIIYLVRNPRDVLHSSIPHLKISPEHAADHARSFISNRGAPQWTASWGTWVSHVREWTDRENVSRCFPEADLIVVRYEDLRNDTIPTLQGILEFLAIGPVDRARVQRAVENASLEKMRAAEKLMLSTSQNLGKSIWVGPIGQGQQNQSLASLGNDVEIAYQQAVKHDPEFSDYLHRFGYELGVPAGPQHGQ
jgi:hypothetical protein